MKLHIHNYGKWETILENKYKGIISEVNIIQIKECIICGKQKLRKIRSVSL